MSGHVIRCEGGNDVLFRKMPIKGDDLKKVIVVPETHNAIIIKDGVALETLPSGKHKIFDKKNSVIDKNIIDADEEIELIFVSKTAKLNIYWGTDKRFDMRDPITGIPIKLGASGEMEVQISNPRKAYLELIGVRSEFKTKDLKERLQGRLLAEVQFQLANVMKDKNLSYDRLSEVLLPVGNAIMPHIAELFDKDYGLKVFSFTISRVLIDDIYIAKIAEARGEKIAREIKKEERDNQERLDNIAYERQMDLKRLEREDYEKYLEVCKLVGWPASKKEPKASECPNCGVKITADMKFCPVCGTEIKVTKIKCPNCGKMITKDDMFCKHCGAEVRK